MNCQACGSDVPDAARFCPSCGQGVHLRADERRVVTVLFGDLVGFTALSEMLDPERVKILVDDMFARLAEDIISFGGQVDKVVGDGIVALFGAPISHGDDPERAVRAALRMQETVRAFQNDVDVPVRMRIGVNTGEALVGSLRADSDYTATGDAVNTASRLQSAADPGAVLVGAETFEATGTAIRYVEVAPINAKGKEEPVLAWRAVEPLGRPGEHRSANGVPIVGRDDELSLMRSALNMADHRRRAQLLVIMGDAGMGKNRLAEEVADTASNSHGALVLTGRCAPYGEANPWQPVAEAIGGALDIGPETPMDTARPKLIATIADLFRAAPEAPEVERSVSGLLHLLGFETPVGALDPQAQVTEMGRSVRTFLQAQANRRMVVLIIADLHWADEAVLRLIDALCNRLARLPFVMLSTARYALNERWSASPGRHNAMVVSLDPLDRDASERLVAALLRGDVNATLRDDLIERAGGNPFVLHELVSLVGDATGPAAPAVALPSSVRGLVSARLDSLTDGEREVLEDAAVVGRRGSVKALVRMVAATRGDIDLLDLLRTLRDKDLILLDREMWSFRSELVREEAYGRLTKTERARRHVGIAEYLMQHGEGSWVVDSVAHHLRRAAETAAALGRVPGLPVDLDEMAVEWLRKAAHSKSADAAVRLLVQAAGLLGPDSPELAPVAIERARLLASQHQLGAAARALNDATDAAQGRPAIAAQITMRTGDIQHRHGDFDAAIDSFADSTAQFRAIDDAAGAAEALRLTGLTYLFISQFEDAERAILDALAVFDELGDLHSAAWSWQNLAWISFARGRLGQAETRVARALEFFDRVNDDGGTAWCNGLLAYVRLHQGRLDEADALSASAYVDARERSEHWGVGMMLVLRASVHLWSGRTTTAVRRAREGMDSFNDVGDQFSETQARAVLARALVLSGQVQEGFGVLSQPAKNLDGHARRENMDLLISTAGVAAAADLGDPEHALAAAGTDGIEGLDPTLIGQGDRMVAIGLALAQLGRYGEARAALVAASDDAADAGPDANARAVLSMVAVAEGRLDEALALAGEVNGAQRSTYVDHALIALTEAFVAARRDERGALSDALVKARALIARTEDRVHDAVVAMAGAVLDPGYRSAVDERLTVLGVDAHGWENLFRAMATAAPALASS